MRESLSVREYRGVDGLARLEEDWRALQGAETPLHLDYDWYRAYVRHAFADDGALAFLRVADASDRPLGILPLEERTERIRRVPTSIWALVGSREGDVLSMAASADFLAANSDAAPPVLASAMDFLRRRRGGPALLLIGRVTASSAAWQAARALGGRWAYGYRRGGFDWIPADRSFEDLAAGLSARFRRNLRARRRKLAALGEVRLEVTSSRDPGAADALQRLMAVEAAGWKGAGGKASALLVNPRTDARDFVEALFSASSGPEARVLELWAGDTCVAAQLWVVERGLMANLKVGYDEAYSRFGPGHLLMEDALQLACGDPDIRIVSLSSHRGWHGDWHPEFAAHHWMYLPLRMVRGALPLALLRLRGRGETRPGGADLASTEFTGR